MNSSFFTTKFTTERLLQSNNKSSYVECGNGIGHLKQAGDQLTSINSLQYGELWVLYVDESTDIVATDKVTTDDEIYEVRGVGLKSFGSIRAKRVLLVKKKL